MLTNVSDDDKANENDSLNATSQGRGGASCV